jgi:hypothetical protein
MSTDFTYALYGLNLVLLTPVSEAAKEWADENIIEMQPRFGGSIPVEPRYFDAVAEGILGAGLTITTH